MKKRKLYLSYSLIFILMCFAVYGCFFLSGRSFIWNWDGWNQHFKALVYYSRWLKDIARSLLIEHRLSVPTYSFHFGYGADIYSTLHYYAIGDPLNLLSVFFSEDRMVYLYNFLILLRLYLAGFCFMHFVLYIKKDTMWSIHMIDKEGFLLHTGILAGTFTYVFCGYALYAAIRHPYFTNPMIYLPLVLLGAEKLLRGKKPFVFILSVFLCAVSNFYFFYAVVLLTVLYVIFRLCMIFAPQWKEAGVRKILTEAILTVARIAGYALIGVAMSAVMLLPVILLFLGDARSESGYVYDLFYSRAYYEKFPSTFLAGTEAGNWCVLAYSAVTLPAVILLFLQKKRYTAFKAAFLLLTVFLLLPTAGHIFNGFSYVANRWNWGYGMLNACILIWMWPKFFSLNWKEWGLLAGICACYTAISCFLLHRINLKFTAHISFQFIVIAAALLCFASALFRRRYQAVLPVLGTFCLLLTLGSIWRNAHYFFVDGNYYTEFISQKSIPDRFLDNEGSALAMLEDNDFWRYTAPNVTRNVSILNGTANTQYNWSLANGKISQFFKSMQVAECFSYVWKGLDDRTMLNTLLGVKYYVANAAKPEEAFVPFGYHKLDASGTKNGRQYDIYQNQYALPLGYTYREYMLRSDYDALSAAGRQEAMLQALVVDAPLEGFLPANPEITSESLPYTMRFSSGYISMQGNSFVVTKSGTAVRLLFEGRAACETSLLLTGLSYEGRPRYDLYNDDLEIDPNQLFTQEDWDALSAEEKREKIYAAEYYVEPTSLDFELELVLSDGTTVKKVLSYNTPKYIWYNNVQDYLLNMGYHEQESVSLLIRFPYVGTYRFEELGIICQPLEQYAAAARERQESVLENLDLHENNASFTTNLVTGTMDLEEPKLLCLSIPDSRGWTAYVDGVKTELINANLMMMALPLAAGTHEIRLEYQTPGLTAGFFLFLFGCACLGLTAWRYRKKPENVEAEKRYKEIL